MRRVLLWCLAILAVGVAAFAGYSLGYRQGQWTGFVAATAKAAATKPARWEDWKYPRMNHQFHSTTGGGGHVAGHVFRPQNCLVGASADSFDQVVAHYAELCGPEGSLAEVKGDLDSGVDARIRHCRHLDDSKRPGAGGMLSPRPVRVRTFAVQTPDYAVTVTVSRADDEKETHVILVHQ